MEGTEDSHRNLVKLKAAAACSVLHGSADITPETWAWAEAVMTHSGRVRAAVRAELEQEQRTQAHARSMAQARSDLTAASTREAYAEVVAANIQKWMRRNTHAASTANQLRKVAVAGSDRSLVPAAIDLLIEAGTVVESGKSRVGSPLYRLAAS